MPRSFHIVPFAVLWLAWLGYWFVAARDVKATRRREALASEVVHRAFVTLGALLLAFPRQPLPWLAARFLPWSMAAYWTGLLTVALGLAVAVWARVHLGRNWSGRVTVKRNHELIRDGPYAHVRHPIYSGMLLAILGTAIAVGEWRGLLAFAAIAVGFWLKLRVEERFMAESFPDAYRRYREEVPALIPFLGRARGVRHL